MLYLIGLGLSDVKDITVKGLEIVKRVDQVYLEAYTSLLSVGKEQLEEFYGRSIHVADRDFVEQTVDLMLDEAVSGDVAFLVVGDPLSATTHTDLILRAHERGIAYRVIHNASIMTAVGSCGLQLYNFGETVSIPFWTDEWQPDSFFHKIISNLKSGLHTLCLLDIKVKEQSIEALMKGRKEYEPARFMSVNVAVKQLMDIIDKRRKESEKRKKEEELFSPEVELLDHDSTCIGLARVGSETQVIQSGTLREMANAELGSELHSLVIPGKCHPLEIDMMKVLSKQFS